MARSAHRPPEQLTDSGLAGTTDGRRDATAAASPSPETASDVPRRAHMISAAAELTAVTASTSAARASPVYRPAR